VQLHSSVSYYKGAGNVRGTHFMKVFSALLSHSWWCK